MWWLSCLLKDAHGFMRHSWPWACSLPPLVILTLVPFPTTGCEEPGDLGAMPSSDHTLPDQAGWAQAHLLPLSGADVSTEPVRVLLLYGLQGWHTLHNLTCGHRAEAAGMLLILDLREGRQEGAGRWPQAAVSPGWTEEVRVLEGKGSVGPGVLLPGCAAYSTHIVLVPLHLFSTCQHR